MDPNNGVGDVLITLLSSWIATLQIRNFAYLHAGVYAGEHGGNHYVIANSGFDSRFGVGMIDVKDIKKDFEKNASFFVVSPPHQDTTGGTSRYIVMQKALASIGLSFC